MSVAAGYESWLQAPFLQPFHGKAFYELLKAIRDGAVTGEAECAISGGQVRVLHFQDGKPTGQRETIAALVREPQIVVAWMPGKTARDDSATLVNRSAIVDLIQRQCSGIADGESGWLQVYYGNERLYAQGDAGTAGFASGLVAQINGTFREIVADQTLRRFSLSSPVSRFGYESLGGSYSAFYRCAPEEQADMLTRLDTLRSDLSEMSTYSGPFEMRSSAGGPGEAEYCLIRPSLYQKLDAAILNQLEETDLPWSAFWLQGDAGITWQHRRGTDPMQQRADPFEALVELVRQAFADDSGGPSDMVLYTNALTIWCDLFDEGFWAIRLDDAEQGFRRRTSALAARVHRMMRRAFSRS
ncbi:MAG: hypothetical protein D6761_07150 [Candidatus Dadabacteria bacterium]|nr:MAG: hypothetical protein D6761_07150 [Candidatus Dadabacteria bacterium]